MTYENQTPMTHIEILFDELIKHYGDGDDRELRVAAKMLLVVLDRFRRYGGSEWPGLVGEYVSIAANNNEKFEQILRSNRGESSEGFLD